MRLLSVTRLVPPGPWYNTTHFLPFNRRPESGFFDTNLLITECVVEWSAEVADEEAHKSVAFFEL